MKKHIRNGKISAFLARGIAKGISEEKATEIVRANLEETARIKGTGRARVTAKTLKRDVKPKADKPMSDAALDRLAKTQSVPAKPGPQTTENDRRDGATYSEDQTAEARSDNNPVNASAPTLREAPEPPTIPELVVPASITFYEVFDALQTLKTQASEVVERNKDDDHPGYWTQSLVDAIADAERIIGRVNGAAVTGGAEQ